MPRRQIVLRSRLVKSRDGMLLWQVELHHSALGNNQFNRYPMKLGPTGMCDFLDKYWDDYYEYAVKYVPNIVKPRECPFGAKTYQIADWIMDSEMLPQYVPTGLWKDYYEYVVEYIPNVAKPGECPLSARIYAINDWIMDARILPPYVPTGLWRVIQVMWDNSTGQSFTMELIFKVYEDGYF
ncbi:conserved hypothetical protein [Culex quinquefasciatus]|uniref:Uncharacterized protein n=1 Tax=Culex quinquefasciatus TaxID=7176 RepID=B0WK51_CULQU|nr:conserved hypothetical protein [Culex quinquefasciatus]|eukprot:XP_001849085.1 conserved hypothetical protein [Culex quinquefasciatus]